MYVWVRRTQYYPPQQHTVVRDGKPNTHTTIVAAALVPWSRGVLLCVCGGLAHLSELSQNPKFSFGGFCVDLVLVVCLAR